MIYYNDVYAMIQAGKIKRLDDLTMNQLYTLYTDPSLDDNTLAEMFSVNAEEVATLRMKYNLNENRMVILRNHTDRTGLLASADKKSKTKLLQDENLKALPIVLTHFLFRNGPVEDMHSEY